MGLIKAALGAVGGVLADQWKEYFYCDSLPTDVLAVKGQKKMSGRSSNTKGSDNVISNGSVIAVADGQCMLIVEQGKVVEVCAEPGEFVYDSSTEPSIFAGSLGESIKESFKNVGKRFAFGGQAGKDQRVYYFNTKEIIGNKYGTPSPVPFRVVDERAAIDIDISIRCFGEYSYRLADPLLFYTNVCGNVEEEYERGMLDSQLRTELLTALQPAFARISAMGIRYSALPGHTTEMTGVLNDELSAKWRDLRGIEIVAFGMSSVKATDEDEAMLKQMQKDAAYLDPRRAAAMRAAAEADAMKTAAGNTAGAMTGFMGMGMAMNAGGNSSANLFAQAQQEEALRTKQAELDQMMAEAQAKAAAAAAAPAAPAADSWKCACGHTATGKFCPECGAKKPEPKPAANTWKCACGHEATGKFCPECGAKRPEVVADGWVCACGAVNKGKFCPECGAKKPAGVPQFKCDKCGWEPADPTKPPKFCPECGDPFDDGDIK